jgi:hypothetical protein
MKRKNKPTAQMTELLKRGGASDYNLAIAAQRELAIALTLPLRQGVLKGDIVADIFEEVDFLPGQSTEFPLDFLAPGTEQEFIAVTVPNTGRIPERHVEGDYVMVPTFDIGSSIDCSLKYIRDGRWDVMARMMQVIEAMFVRKKNDDAWHTITMAGYGRNLVAYDDAATAGLFTKRLISLMKTAMRRNAGGNSTSLNKGKLTDAYISPESLEDIRSWDLTQVDEFTRRQIFLADGDDNAGESALSKIFGVNLHDIDELGVAQLYQLYYTATLGGTMPVDKQEIMVGLDLYNTDCFVSPRRQEVEIFEDPTFHRQNRAGMYGRAELGWGALDSRRVLLGAI